MKALVYDKQSSPYKLRLDEIEKPQVKDHEVLLKVVTVSLNAADYRSMNMGIIPSKKIFGSAVAGIIEGVGKNIQNFKVAEAVIGDLSDFGFGGLAEYLVAPEKAFAHKPENISFEDAVCLPVAATTALKAMRDQGDIQKGQRVLIVGSSGGVGIAAVQLAKYFGAEVTAVCSSKNVEQAKTLGADQVIDYTKTDWTKSDTRYDLILAINGNYPLLAYRRLLSNKGRYVMVGGAYAQIFKSLLFGWFLSFGGKKMKTLSAKADPADLAFVATLLGEGKLKAVIHKRYALEEAGEGMEEVSKGHAPGKIIVTI